MPFYKFLLKVGHASNHSHYGEMPVYIYDVSYVNARKNAKRLPMVKHSNTTSIISSRLIEEEEFIGGVVKDVYGEMIDCDIRPTPLQTIVKMFSYIKGYKFVTDEGIAITRFCNRYVNADKKQKRIIEQEYNEWAIDLIAKQENKLEA